MTVGILREAKGETAIIPSGAGVSNPINLQGYGLAGLFVPVLTSAGLAFQVAPSAGAAYSTVADKTGPVFSAATPAGTGGVALSTEALAPLGAYFGPVRISALVAQAGDRTFIWHLKG